MSDFEVIKNPQLDIISTELITMKEKNVSNALTYAIQSQLTVINSIYKANLLTSSVDLILENLRLSISKCTDDNEKQEIQNIYAATLSSLVFFSEAKIYYEEKKWAEDGKEVLKQGCEMLTSAINKIIEMYGTDSPFKLQSPATTNKDFIENLFERIFLADKTDQIRNMRKEFYTFVHSLVQRLEKYSDLFGKSLVLVGLIDRYMEFLISYECGQKAPFLIKVEKVPNADIKKNNEIVSNTKPINKRQIARNKYEELIKTFDIV